MFSSFIVVILLVLRITHLFILSRKCGKDVCCEGMICFVAAQVRCSKSNLHQRYKICHFVIFDRFPVSVG